MLIEHIHVKELGIELIPQRKNNPKRKFPRYIQNIKRKKIDVKNRWPLRFKRMLGTGLEPARDFSQGILSP